MPSMSRKQHNLMAMVAHDPQAAKRTGVSQSVGKEFVAADKKAGNPRLPQTTPPSSKSKPGR